MKSLSKMTLLMAACGLLVASPVSNALQVSASEGEKVVKSSSTTANEEAKTADAAATSTTTSAEAAGYESVFAMYKGMLDGKAGSSDKYDFVQNVGGLNTYNISSWTIESLYNLDYSNLYYSYTDLDNNGEAELVVSVKGQDGYVSPNAFYYLADGVPTLAAEGVVAGVGGYREGFMLRTDGSYARVSWLSGTGDGNAELYQLPSNGGGAVKLQEAAFSLRNTELGAIFPGETVDLQTLEWTPMF